MGRPLMPPLSFTHLKYAVADTPDALKSSGPVLLTRPPNRMGSPVARCPVFMPQSSLDWPDAAVSGAAGAFPWACTGNTQVPMTRHMTPTKNPGCRRRFARLNSFMVNQPEKWNTNKTRTRQTVGTHLSLPWQPSGFDVVQRGQGSVEIKALHRPPHHVQFGCQRRAFGCQHNVIEQITSVGIAVLQQGGQAGQ